MASANDWDTRKARVQDQFTVRLPALITNYELKTRALDDLTQQMQKLDDEKGRLEHEINMAEQDAATADRVFLERKTDMPDPFVPSKVYTIQDFTFLFFFISYLLFLIAVSMIVQAKLKVFFGGMFLLIPIGILMYRYI